MPVPVWAALLAVAVAKKVVVFTAAKVPYQSLSRILEHVGLCCLMHLSMV